MFVLWNTRWPKISFPPPENKFTKNLIQSSYLNIFDGTGLIRKIIIFRIPGYVGLLIRISGGVGVLIFELIWRFCLYSILLKKKTIQKSRNCQKLKKVEAAK